MLIDGWRVEVELEADDRAALRDRARRGADRPGRDERAARDPGASCRAGSSACSWRPGDLVDAGQPLLVIEAMKMLNELRAPRAGRVERVAVAAGDGVELGDLLVGPR